MRNIFTELMLSALTLLLLVCGCQKGNSSLFSYNDDILPKYTSVKTYEHRNREEAILDVTYCLAYRSDFEEFDQYVEGTQSLFQKLPWNKHCGEMSGVAAEELKQSSSIEIEGAFETLLKRRHFLALAFLCSSLKSVSNERSIQLAAAISKKQFDLTALSKKELSRYNFSLKLLTQ